MLQAGAIIADHLRLVRQLGSGGMGSVWIAEQTRLGGLVAVKFLSTSLLEHEGARSRFDREAKLAHRIKSQHVVQVHDHGLTQDIPSIPYIVMELLEGTDLAKLLEREGPIGLVRTVEIVEQICDALTKAHDAGIVHRDIKPENVFVLNETRTFIKLLDFGVAQGHDGQLNRLTQTGLLLGTAHYMSPEQLFSGKHVDLRTDLWSLGVLTYQALTNDLPFQGETFGQLCLQVRDGSFEPVSFKVNVPPSIDEWFSRALATDREHRFQSAAEMATTLKQAALGQPMDWAPSRAPAFTSVSATGTVRVDKSDMTHVHEELAQARGKTPSSQADIPPETQRLGSQADLALSLTRTNLPDVPPSHPPTSTTQAYPNDLRQPAAVVDGDTPLANLSGSFGTEAKGVLALPPSTKEAGRRRPIVYLTAALLAGGGAFTWFLTRNTTESTLGNVAALGAPPSIIADVVGATPEVPAADTQARDAAMATPSSSATATNLSPAPSTRDETATRENTPNENGTASNGASPTPENAVTGGEPKATDNSPSVKNPKPLPAIKPPKPSVLSNDVSSGNPPSPTPSPAPAPAPAPNVPKYRGF
jgi:serine/threonine protein kinase